MALDWRIFVFGGLVALVGAYTAYHTATAPQPPAASAQASPAATTAAASPSAAAATPAPADSKARKFLEHTPAGRVETYVDGDWNGERLEAANWPAKYKALVNWATEPSWDQAYLIRSYNIETGKEGDRQATAFVTYDTLGEFELDTFKYTASPTRQTVTYTLEKDKDQWLVGYPMLRPHVSVPAMIAFLERQAQAYPLKKPAIDEALTQLRAEQARLKLK